MINGERMNRQRYKIPEEKKIRVIIDTDAACEADDPFAIVQALLSPKLIVRGIIAEHFNAEGSVERSLDEIRTILRLMDLEVPSFRGQSGPLDKYPEEISEGVRFIAEEALKIKEGEEPLYVLCQGAISNVAAAFRLHPDIKEKIRIIWIGTHGAGNIRAPFREFNAGNDITAANEVLSSGADIWLVPSTVYTTVTVGLSELRLKVYPCGKIGEHLFENMIRYNLSDEAFWTQGESWSLGDSPAIAIALNPGCGRFREEPAPFIEEDTSSSEKQDAPLIRVYSDVDSRYILEDLYAKLKLFTD